MIVSFVTEDVTFEPTEPLNKRSEYTAYFPLTPPDPMR